jgi:Holliday junction resolvase-like predicted endonuclease
MIGKDSAAERGRRAETAVAEHLMSLGYRICAANYQVNRLGELDLVVSKDRRLTVVEVKARSRAEAFGGLPVTITPAKLRRLRQVAWCYLKEKQLMNIDLSFLAAFVQMDPAGNITNISTIPIEWL